MEAARSVVLLKSSAKTPIKNPIFKYLQSKIVYFEVETNRTTAISNETNLNNMQEFL